MPRPIFCGSSACSDASVWIAESHLCVGEGQRQRLVQEPRCGASESGPSRDAQCLALLLGLDLGHAHVLVLPPCKVLHCARGRKQGLGQLASKKAGSRCRRGGRGAAARGRDALRYHCRPMTESSLHRWYTLGTGTLPSWLRASRMRYSRSMAWAVLLTSGPGGRVRTTYFLPLLPVRR